MKRTVAMDLWISVGVPFLQRPWFRSSFVAVSLYVSWEGSARRLWGGFGMLRMLKFGKENVECWGILFKDGWLIQRSFWWGVRDIYMSVYLYY